MEGNDSSLVEFSFVCDVEDFFSIFIIIFTLLIMLLQLKPHAYLLYYYLQPSRSLQKISKIQ